LAQPVDRCPVSSVFATTLHRFLHEPEAILHALELGYPPMEKEAGDEADWQ
jgi:hypothetical protein